MLCVQISFLISSSGWFKVYLFFSTQSSVDLNFKASHIIGAGLRRSVLDQLLDLQDRKSQTGTDQVEMKSNSEQRFLLSHELLPGRSAGFRTR